MFDIFWIVSDSTRLVHNKKGLVFRSFDISVRNTRGHSKVQSPTGYLQKERNRIQVNPKQGLALLQDSKQRYHIISGGSLHCAAWVSDAQKCFKNVDVEVKRRAHAISYKDFICKRVVALFRGRRPLQSMFKSEMSVWEGATVRFVTTNIDLAISETAEQRNYLTWCFENSPNYCKANTHVYREPPIPIQRIVSCRVRWISSHTIWFQLLLLFKVFDLSTQLLDTSIVFEQHRL